MKFTGDLFVQVRSIKKAADLIQSPNSPNAEGRNHLLWFLGLVVMRGHRVLRYDSTVEANLAAGEVDAAVTALRLHGPIEPDHHAGMQPALPVAAWKKAIVSGEVGRVLESPPPIPREFPQVDEASSQRWLGTWSEVLHQIGKGDADAQFKELMSNRGLRGNKLLAGMTKCSQEVGPEMAGVTQIVQQWDKSSVQERYLLSSGLINCAFRPFLLVSMANHIGSLALLEEPAFRAFSRLEFSLVTMAATAILKAQSHNVDVTDECLLDDEPDLILLAGLKVLKEADPRRGPYALIEKALAIAEDNLCLPQYFQSIVLKSANLVQKHPVDLVNQLNELKTELKHSGLCSKIPVTRRWLNTISPHASDIVIDLAKRLGPSASIFCLGQALEQDPFVSYIAGETAGVMARRVMNWVEKHFPNADNADIDAAASAWSNLSIQWINAAQVERDFSRFWNAPKPVAIGF